MGILMGEGAEGFGSISQDLGAEKPGQEEGVMNAGSSGGGFSLCVPASTPSSTPAEVIWSSPSRPHPGDDPRVTPVPRPSLNPSVDLYRGP